MIDEYQTASKWLCWLQGKSSSAANKCVSHSSSHLQNLYWDSCSFRVGKQNPWGGKGSGGLFSFPFYFNALLLILTVLFLHRTPASTCRCALLSPPSPLKLLQPCIPFDAKRPLNCSQNLYTVLCGESARNSNIHSDQTSPRILIDATFVMHFRGWERMCEFGQGKQCVIYVMAPVVKVVTELSVEWVMSLHGAVWWILQGARTMFYSHEGQRQGLSCSLSLQEPL